MDRRIGTILAILVFVVAACLLGKDSSPLTPHPAAAASWAVIVDDLSGGFTRGGPQGDCSSPGTDDFSNCYWCYMNSGGWGGHYWYTYNGQYYGQPNTGDYGKWRPDLPYNKTYKVCAYIPNNHAYTHNARYQIFYSGGSKTVGVNQQPVTGWVDLGNYPFAAGTAGYVLLDDITGEAFGTHQIGMDAMEWVPDGGGCGNYPGPSIPAPGAGSSRQTLFQQAYDRKGGRGTMGYAFGNTYWWNAIVRQDFDSAPLQGASIMHDESQDSPILSVPAWVVQGGIRSCYINSWPDLGPPESDQFTNYSGHSQSNFRYGYIWWDGSCHKEVWPNAWSIKKPGRDTNAYIGLSSVPGGSPGTDLSISGVQFVIDDKGPGGGGTGDIAWASKDIGTIAITPNSNLTWTELDEARSLIVGFDVVASDGATHQLLYALNAPDLWSTLGWADMTGTVSGFNSWLTVTRNVYNDFSAEYGIPPRSITKLYLGHFVDDNWSGDHGGTLGGLALNDADVIIPASPPNVQGGVTANPWVAFSAEPVNLGTGEYSYQHTDVSIPGAGYPLQFARSYSTQNPASTRLGFGWQDNLSVRLVFDDSDHATANVSVVQEQGRRDDYGRLADGTYQDPPGIFDTLSRTDDNLTCWGDNSEGQATPPGGTFSQVGAGLYHTCGVKTDGTLACWGLNNFGQTTAPDGTFRQVSGGNYHTCGVRTDGTLACWGNNADGQATPPAGTFSQVSAGYGHTCGLKTDGTLACWGWDYYGQATPPAGTFSQLSAGWNDTCGVKTDGTIACWGLNDFGQATPPAGTFSQVSAGAEHTCGLRTDGTLACWGRNDYGQATPPDATFSQVSAGGWYSCGVKTDGIMACWGLNNFGQTTAPEGTFSQVSGGAYHSCAVSASFLLQRKDNSKWQFDANGRPLSFEDQNGNRTTLDYDADGKLTSTTDASGRHLTFASDTAGRITSVTDPLGRVTSYGYDDSGNLISVTDPAGGVTSYTYDSQHRMTSMTDARGHTVMTNTFDSSGRVTAQSNAAGDTWTFAYDIGQTSDTDPRGCTTVHSYDARFRETQKVDCLGGVTSYTYDARGNRNSITDPLGHTTNYVFDSSGNLLSLTDALGNATHFTYDAKGNVLTETDPLGNTSTYTYDGSGNQLTVTDALGNVASKAYNPAGQPISLTDPRGNTTLYAYDTDGNHVGTTDPAGGLSSSTYDAAGRLLSNTDQLGHTTVFTYSPLDKVLSRTDAMGNVTSHTYDANGNTLTTTDARGKVTTYVYDALDRVSSSTDPLGGTTTYSYDCVGNRVSTTDANGNTTSFAYDLLGHIISSTDSLGHTISYTYDASGNKTSETDANGNVTAYTYDELSRLTFVTDPEGNVTSYTYDAAGNRLSRLDANGMTTSYTYDALNRLTRITYPDQPAVSYTYDALGNRLTMTDLTGTTAYSYDVLNRPVSVVYPGGSTVSYGYDAAGNRTLLTYPDGKVVTYGYDDASRLTTVIDWAARVTTYAYDAASNLTGTDLPNGVHSARSYTDANQLLSIAHTKDASNLISVGYTLDSIGNRLSRTETVGADAPVTDTYSYDNLYRLTSVDYASYPDQTYSYDPMGNRTQLVEGATTTGYTYDDADRLLTAGSITFEFDANGNQVREGNRTFTYDRENRLIQVADWTSAPDGTCADTNWDGTVNSGDLLAIANSFGTRGGMAGYDPVIDPRQDGAINSGDLLLVAGKLLEQCHVVDASAYNGDGLRVYQSENGTTRRFTWDVAAELPMILQESSGTTYEYGLELILEETSGVATYHHQDGLGSTVMTTDATGAAVGTYAYDVFGAARACSPSFGFAGEQGDASGLVYLRARYYEPELGRLVTADPRGRESGNPYPYADSNPALLTDPTGLFSISQAWDSYLKFAKKATAVEQDVFVKVNLQLLHAALTVLVPGSFWIDPRYLPPGYRPEPLIKIKITPPLEETEPPSGVDYLAVASAYYVKPSQASSVRSGPTPGVLEPHPMGSPPPRPIPPALDPIVLQLSSFNGRK
jgi:RHS repeat-associated protein